MYKIIYLSVLMFYFFVFYFFFLALPLVWKCTLLVVSVHLIQQDADCEYALCSVISLTMFQFADPLSISHHPEAPVVV